MMRGLASVELAGCSWFGDLTESRIHEQVGWAENVTVQGLYIVSWGGRESQAAEIRVVLSL